MSPRLPFILLAAAAALFGRPASAGSPPPTTRTLMLVEGGEPVAEPVPLTTSSLVIGFARFAFSIVEASGHVLLVEHLDANPVVTPLPIGEGVLPAGDIMGMGYDTMIRLSATRVLVAHWGVDGLPGTGDEGVLLLDDLGGANTVVPIPIGRMEAPHLVRIDERTAATLDDDNGAVLLSDLGGANDVVPLATWRPRLALSPARFLTEDESGYALVRLEPGGPQVVLLPDDFEWASTVALTGLRVLVPGSPGLRLVPDIEAPNTSEILPVTEFSEVVRAAPDRALVHLVGADLLPGTEDDAIATLESLGNRNRMKVVATPGANSAPVALGRRTAVIRVGGEGMEAGLAVVRGASSHFVPLATSARPVALSPTAFLVASEGSTPFETPDDEVVSLFTLRRRPKAVATVVPFAQSSSIGPVLLGNGRAVLSDYTFEDNYTRHLRILDGLPHGIRLEDVELATAGSEVAFEAGFALPDPAVFGLADLTVRIGSVKQTIPAESIRKTSRGFRYRDPNGEQGFFRLVEYDSRRNVLRVTGRSAEPSAPLGTNRVVSLESTEFYVARAAPEPAD